MRYTFKATNLIKEDTGLPQLLSKRYSYSQKDKNICQQYPSFISLPIKLAKFMLHLLAVGDRIH
ncbi:MULTISPECIES: hypothetical protein [unclassified Anabaena]|uniref:hypothetical protein n=1 Tax=unclassified Anabaena TaxID=2619674 RepID=UPI0039C63223